LPDVSFSRHIYPLKFLLRAFRAVLRSRLLASGNAGRVQRATHNVVTHAWQVLHTAAADEHDRVLLQVMANAGDISGDFDPVGQTHARDFAQRRVRLLRGLRVHAGTNAASLRTLLQRRAGSLIIRRLAALLHKLIECRHCFSCSLNKKGLQPRTNTQTRSSRWRLKTKFWVLLTVTTVALCPHIRWVRSVSLSLTCIPPPKGRGSASLNL